jgi:glutamate N-acetyltransferase/amino-acid N-acetyltransferase
MAVNPPALSALEPVAGIRLGTGKANIRKPDRRDLVVIECAPGTQAAAVFTRNRFCAAPVIVAREHRAHGAPRALVINTGNANAGTGAAGVADARTCCTSLAAAIGCEVQRVWPFSTGVIGERLPVERIVAGIPQCLAALSEHGWNDAAYGIMTTDTVPKGVSRRVTIDGKPLTVTGIAKGAGMIRPDMATMLAFVATDARVAPELLQRTLDRAVDDSFNRITVDGDTSTNDACVLLASGAGAAIEAGQESERVFLQALTEVCQTLAQAIVRDGEGATKFITVEVEGGASEADCLAVAYTIAHSPLIKTAFFASDPNWGRILAAIGRAPAAQLDVDRVSICLDDVCVVRAGGLAADYAEARGAAVMRQAEIAIRVNLGLGSAAARVWTTDLSHDYVRINAEYRS